MKKFRLLPLFMLPLVFLSCGGRSEKYATGLVIDAEAYEKIPQKARLVTRDYEFLPGSVDLRAYVPYAGDQGNYGTCAAWSTAYCAMTAAESIAVERFGRDEATYNVFSPYFLYRTANPLDRNAEKGMSIEDALWTLKYDGVPRRTDWEWQMEFSDFEADFYEGSSLYKIGDYATLFDWEEEADVKILAVKKSLSQYKPVVIAFYGYPDSFFKTQGDSWKPGFFEAEGKDNGHAMVIVAYDDYKNGGSFLFQNSWGNDWGDGGCKWVGYQDFARYTRGAYEMSGVLFDNTRYGFPEPEQEPEPWIEPEPEPVKTTVYKGSFSIPLYYGDDEMAVECRDSVYYAQGTYTFTDRFRLELTNTMPCYVYVFSSDDATGRATRLFPPPGRNISALLDYSSNTIALPAEDLWIGFDSVAGTDYLVVLYSLSELDIDGIMTSYEAQCRAGFGGKRNFKDRVRAALDSNAVLDESRVEFGAHGVQFEAWTVDREKAGILPVLLVFDHE